MRRPRSSLTRGSPFLSLDDAPDTYEWVKMAILSPLCILRILSVVAHLTAFWILASLKLCGLPAEMLQGHAPMPRWRNALFGAASKVLMASVLLCSGAWVTFKGRRHLREARRQGAIGVFNHVSYMDPFVLLRLTSVTGVAKAGIDDLPLIGQVGKVRLDSRCIQSFCL